MERPAWKYAAATLGLGLHDPIGHYEAGAAFARLERSRGPRALGAPTEAQWMYGRVEQAQRAIDVLVLNQTITSTDNMGGHHSSMSSSSTTYTHILARIDPPLFVGLKLSAPRTMEPLFGPSLAVLTGDPSFDTAFTMHAAAPREAIALVRRTVAPPNDVMDHLHALASKWKLRVSDTSVDIWTTYSDDPVVLGPGVAGAAALAAYLGFRRATVPRSEADAGRLATLRGLAESARLVLDEARYSVAGTLAGLPLRIALEPENDGVYTSAVVELPRSLELGLQLTQQGALQFIASFFGSQDVRVGDPAFDDAFLVKAKDEAGVRALFASQPAARHALVALAADSKLSLDDERLVVRWPRVVDGAMLHAILQHLVALAPVLAPSAPAAAYR